MKKYIKTLLRPSTYVILFIVQIISLILVKQEVTNLYYTGIQYKGFSNIILDKITTSTYDKYKLLMKREDFNYFDSCYKYNAKKNIYILNKYNKEELEIITKKVLPVNYLFYNGLQTSKKKVLNINDYTNIYNILNKASEKKANRILYKVQKELKKQYSQKEIKELCKKEIQHEYHNLGYNINKIKSKYINSCFLHITSLIIIIIIITFIKNYIKNKTSYNYKNINITFNSLLLGLCLYYLLNTNLLLSIFLSVIYILLIILIIEFNFLRKNNFKINKFLTNIENKFNFDILINQLNKFIWFYLLIIFYIINIFIYNRYSTYHIFVGLIPYEFQIKFNYFYIFNLSVLLFIYLLLNIITYYQQISPQIKEKKSKKNLTKNKLKKKKKKSKKKR